MFHSEQPYTFDRVVRMILGALTIAILFALVRYLSDVLIPFAAAIVLAYLIHPLVVRVNRKIKRRGLAVAVTLLVLGLAGSIVAVLLTSIVVAQVTSFTQELRDLRKDVVSALVVEPPEIPSEPPALPGGSETDRVSSSDQGESGPDPEEREVETGQAGEAPARSTFGRRELQEALYVIETEGRQWSRAEKVAYIKDRLSGTLLGTALEQLTDYMKTDEFNKLLINAAKRIGVGGWTALTFVVNTLLGLTGLIIVLLYLIFLLVDFPHYERTWKTLLPPAYRDSITGFLEEFQVAMRRYFRGQFVIAVCMAVLFTIGFTLIGLPMAVPMGLFMGLLNMVPYLQIVGLVPATALALLGAVQGDSSAVWAVVWLFVVVGVAQLVQDAIITPRVMRRATGLKPVAILLGVFIWGKMLGFLGLILAIPLTCLGIAYYRRHVLEHSPEETKPVTE